MNENKYCQMAKNTVDSKNQLKDTPLVRFHNIDGNGIRIMFLGNSMTLHGSAPAIGWYPECGMAASAPEKDYVHILEKKVLEVDPNASFCICQVANWEREYKNGASTYHLYEAAQKSAFSKLDNSFGTYSFIEAHNKSSEFVYSFWY
jgi:hypothetical protein